jgi:DNA-binding NarL/FixJ family response regulator
MLELQAEWKVVGEACNGRHAVETCHEHRPHVTVMDLVMPEMDGLQAARHLTRRHPHIPILMVTLDASRQLEEEARKAGIKGLCPKAHMKCLRGAVAALLRGETYFYSQQAA